MAQNFRVTHTSASKPDKLIGPPRWTWLARLFWSVIGALSGMDRRGLQPSRKSPMIDAKRTGVVQGAKPPCFDYVLNILRGGGKACRGNAV